VDDIQYIERLTVPQMEQLHQLYQGEWWTKGRSLADVRTMIEGSDHVFGFCEPRSERLVAFARVLTDGVFKALIFDVIVDPAYRGRGLGKDIMNRILEHPTLSRVKHFELCGLSEMIPFYTRWGFTAELGELCFMRRESQ
jgi:predicted GNAT family N-acyltransferase